MLGRRNRYRIRFKTHARCGILFSGDENVRQIRLDNQVCFPLYACAKEVVRRYRKPLEALNLTYTQYLVMMVLWEHGGMTEGALGKRVHLDSGTLAPLLKRLQKAGYIDRVRPENNENKLFLSLTAEGFLIGVGFLLLLDEVTPHLHFNNQEEGPRSGLKRTTKLILAVTLHNVPEGMAVGVVYAGFLSGNAGISAAGALALALGIAIQNFPEGAIVSMPLRAEGMNKGKTFLFGVLSGVVEPIAAVVTVLAAEAVVPIMPYLLAFAAGAMMYVVVEELVPETSEGKHSNFGTVAFSLGFVLMMVLDVALG